MRFATPDTEAKIAALNEEIVEIHCANSLYWNQGQDHPKAATAQYELRQERLEAIREELATLLRGRVA